MKVGDDQQQAKAATRTHCVALEAKGDDNKVLPLTLPSCPLAKRLLSLASHTSILRPKAKGPFLLK